METVDCSLCGKGLSPRRFSDLNVVFEVADKKSQSFHVNIQFFFSILCTTDIQTTDNPEL